MSVFGTKQPQEDRKPLWEKELRVKDRQTIRFVPLQGANETLTVLVHKNIKFGNRFDSVVCGKKNGHLFEPIACPFCDHPDKEVSKVAYTRYAIVYALDGNPTLNKQVAYVDLKYSVQEALAGWEKAISDRTGKEVTVTGREVNVSRVGAGLQNTKYTTIVFDPTALPDGLDADVTELVEYLKGRYGSTDEQRLENTYVKAFAPTSPVTETAVAPGDEEVEIPF